MYARVNDGTVSSPDDLRLSPEICPKRFMKVPKISVCGFM